MMPVHRQVFGRNVNVKYPPRRFILAFTLTAVGLVVLIVSFASHQGHTVGEQSRELVGATQQLIDQIPRPSIPKLYNPFGDAAHQPPTQPDSASAEAKWYSHLSWLRPFSSVVTLEHDRSLLPPLANRTPIYTFYVPEDPKNSDVMRAENELLVTWRKAWWAAGFRPMVLGRADAKRNTELWDMVSRLNVDEVLKGELERFLAWGYMEGGILANWLALPMGKYQDETLQYLRAGNFSMLTRYQGLRSGLFTGKKEDINNAIREALQVPNLENTLSLIEAIPSKFMDMDSRHESIAFYEQSTIKSKYDTISDKLQLSRSNGLKSLRELINAHLHNTWQNIFEDGIELLQPHAPHMSPFTVQAQEIAARLRKCPASPLPSSCPPNRPECVPCSPTKLMALNESEVFTNTSTRFVIGSIPHPFTYNSLQFMKDKLDVAFIRRKTFRDRWLVSTTEHIMGPDMSGPQRLVRFKEAVASVNGQAQTLWISAESDEKLNLEWLFGFNLPIATAEEKPSATALKLDDSHIDSEQAKGLMDKAKKTVQSKKTSDKEMVDMVEAWNLADSEAWRFARAFLARREVERLKWDEDEEDFAGSERHHWRTA